MPKSLVENFVDQFRLCKVQEGELVAVIAELGEKDTYVEAAVSAARQLGASALVLHASSLSSPMLPPYQADGREVPALLAAAKELARRERKTTGQVLSDLARRALTGAGIAHAAEEPAAVNGFKPFPARGPLVTNDVIDRLRDSEGV